MRDQVIRHEANAREHHAFSGDGVAIAKCSGEKDTLIPTRRESLNLNDDISASRWSTVYFGLRTMSMPDAQTLESLAEDDNGKLVRAKWNAVKLTSEGAEASTGIRIGFAGNAPRGYVKPQAPLR